ncbi:hypothetical protein EYR38_009914 [Pleurotus pulmonarius]|nr:hypothetical protein EYR38_009914 [Pleurotus pulmonarius]
MILPSEECNIEAVPGLLHENLKQGAQQGPLDFFSRSISWNTQEYPEDGVPAWESELPLEGGVLADMETQTEPLAPPECSNYALLRTPHPETKCEGNGIETAPGREPIVIASPDSPGNPMPKRRAENGDPVILRNEEIPERLHTRDFHLPLSEINSQETPWAWEKPDFQLDDAPRSSRFLYDTLARDRSLEWGEVAFDESLVNFRDTSELSNSWRNSQPKQGTAIQDVRFVRKRGGDRASQDSSPSSVSNRPPSPLSEFEILQSPALPTIQNDPSERARRQRLDLLNQILTDSPEACPSFHSLVSYHSKKGLAQEPHDGLESPVCDTSANLERKLPGPVRRAHASLAVPKGAVNDMGSGNDNSRMECAMSTKKHGQGSKGAAQCALDDLGVPANAEGTNRETAGIGSVPRRSEGWHCDQLLPNSQWRRKEELATDYEILEGKRDREEGDAELEQGSRTDEQEHAPEANPRLSEIPSPTSKGDVTRVALDRAEANTTQSRDTQLELDCSTVSHLRNVDGRYLKGTKEGELTVPQEALCATFERGTQIHPRLLRPHQDGSLLSPISTQEKGRESTIPGPGPASSGSKVLFEETCTPKDRRNDWDGSEVAAEKTNLSLKEWGFGEETPLVYPNFSRKTYVNEKGYSPNEGVLQAVQEKMRPYHHYATKVAGRRGRGESRDEDGAREPHRRKQGGRIGKYSGRRDASSLSSECAGSPSCLPERRHRKIPAEEIIWPVRDKCDETDPNLVENGLLRWKVPEEKELVGRSAEIVGERGEPVDSSPKLSTVGVGFFSRAGETRVVMNERNEPSERALGCIGNASTSRKPTGQGTARRGGLPSYPPQTHSLTRSNAPLPSRSEWQSNQFEFDVPERESPPPQARRKGFAPMNGDREAQLLMASKIEHGDEESSHHIQRKGEDVGNDIWETANVGTEKNVSNGSSALERHDKTRSRVHQDRALAVNLPYAAHSRQHAFENEDVSQHQDGRTDPAQASQATRSTAFPLKKWDLDTRGKHPLRSLANRGGVHLDTRRLGRHSSEPYWIPERGRKEFQTTKRSILNSATNIAPTYLLEPPPLHLFNPPLDTVDSPSSKLNPNSPTSTTSLPEIPSQSHIASDMSSNSYTAVPNAGNAPPHPQATIGRVIQTLIRTGMPPAYPVDRVPQPHISLPIQFPSGGQDQALLTAQRLQRYGLVQAAMTQAQPQQVAGVMSSNNFVEHQSHMVNNGKIRIYLANDAEVSRRSSIVPHLVERNRGTAYLILLEPFDAPAVNSPPTPSHRLLDAFTFSVADSQYPYNIIVPPGVLSPRPVPAVAEPVVQRAPPTIRIPPRRHSFGEIDQNRDEDTQRPPRSQSTSTSPDSPVSPLILFIPLLDTRTRGTRRGGAPRQVGRRRSARLRGIPASTLDIDHVSEPMPERQEAAPQAPESNHPPTPFPSEGLPSHHFPASQQSFRTPVRTSTPPGLPVLNDATRRKNIEDLRNLQQRVRLGAPSNSPSPPSDSTSHRTSSHASEEQGPVQPSLEPTIKEEYQSDPPITSLTLEDPKSSSEFIDCSPPRNQLALRQGVNDAEYPGILTTRYVRSPSPMESSEITQPSSGTEGRPPSPVLAYPGDVTMKDDTNSFHLPSPATSLPTPNADSSSTSDNGGEVKKEESGPLTMTMSSTSESDINQAYSSVNIQDHITQLLRQVALEIAAEEGEVLVPSSSPPQGKPPMGSSTAKGAKKPRFGSPIGSGMDRRKAIRSRPPPSKGKASTSSTKLNQPPLQHAFHVWKPESGEGPVLIVPDSDSEEAAEFFKNAVVVEESEDSFVVQVPQGSHGLAAAMNSAFQHNHQMLQELLDEEKENVPPGSEVVVDMETTSSMSPQTPPPNPCHPASTPSPRILQQESQQVQGDRSPVASLHPTSPQEASLTPESLPYQTPTPAISKFSVSEDGIEGQVQEGSEAERNGYTPSTSSPSSHVHHPFSPKPTSFSLVQGCLVSPVPLCMINAFAKLEDLFIRDSYLEIRHDQPDLWGFNHAYSTLFMTEGMAIPVASDTITKDDPPFGHPYVNPEGQLIIPASTSFFDYETQYYPYDGFTNVLMPRGDPRFGRWQDDGDYMIARIALLCKEYITREYVTPEMWERSEPTQEEKRAQQAIVQARMAPPRSFDYRFHNFILDSHRFDMDWSQDKLKLKIPRTPSTYGETATLFIRNYSNPWASQKKEICYNLWNPKISALRHLRLLHIAFIRIITRYLLKPGFTAHLMTSPLLTDATRHYFTHHCHIFRVLFYNKPLVSQGFSHTCFHSRSPLDPPIEPLLTTYKANPLLTPEEDEYLANLAKVFDSMGRGCIGNAARTMRGLVPDLPISIDILFQAEYLEPYAMFDGAGHRRPMSWRIPL